MKSYQYLIIGGGLAGGRAVDGIRQVDPDGSVGLVTQEQHRPYERPPLSKKYLRGEADQARVYLEETGHYADKGVDLLTGARATELDPAERRVTLDDGRELGYDKLLLATGGRARRLPIAGSDLSGVSTLRTIEDSDQIRRAAGEARHALVMGGSFIGSEVAASLSQLGVRATMIFPESRLLERIVPEELSDRLAALFEDHGVEVLPGTVSEGLEGDDRVERATLDNGQTLSVDLVVMGVGIRLNTELAGEAGLQLNEQDALVVDQYLRTSDPHVYAAGDIAAWPDPTFGQRLRVEHWDVARRQGRRAGRNMAGEQAPYTALPYFFSDLFDLSFEVWGDLSSWNQTVLRGSLDEGRFAFYYFDRGRLVGVLAVDRPSAERTPMQELIKARPAYDEVADKLGDETVNLKSLVDGEGARAKEKNGPALSFAEDISPMFRAKDVEEMKEASNLDLSDYEQVRQRAEAIYARLKDGSMPCDGPWPEEKVERFRRWMDQGKKE